MTYRIALTPTAMKLLSDISDRRIREKIGGVIDRLSEEPEKQGKALLGELTGFRSVRAVGQRYRVIYKVTPEEILVVIVAAGIRKEGDKQDIYNLAKKLFRVGLLGSKD
jgi:mRNA interferase RelE/StbE